MSGKAEKERPRSSWLTSIYIPQNVENQRAFYELFINYLVRIIIVSSIRVVTSCMDPNPFVL